MPDFMIIVGYRKGMLPALRKFGLAYLLCDKSLKAAWTKSGGNELCLGGVEIANPELVGFEEIWLQISAHFPATGRCLGVLAGKEWSVFLAAKIRAKLNLPGVTLETAELATDKWKMKQGLERVGKIPMTAHTLCADRKDFAQFMQKNGRPIVAKLRQGSGSRGIHFLHQDDFSPDHWDSYLFEKFVHGPELSVESFIVGGEVCFTNVTEYYRKAHVNLLPRPLDPDLRAHLMSLNQAVIDGLKISRGMSHAEFYLSPEGLVFGEVALRPPGGYIMELMAMSYQIDPWLCLLHAEVDESPIELRKLVERARPEAHYVAAYVVHPGEGTIASIQGLEAVENHPAVMSIKLKAVAGDHISARLGLGMDCGVAFLKHSSYLGLTQAIDEITQTLEFSMTVKQKLLK